MFDLSADTTLEKGTMINPATGRETDYEELWLEEEPGSVSGNTIRCVVLQMENEAQDRGMMVLLGRFCQAVSRTETGITAERWLWSDSDGWTRTLRSGTLRLPCTQVLANLESLHSATTVLVGGREWAVIEVV